MNPARASLFPRLIAVFAWLLALSQAHAGGPADELMRLVPTDASLVVSIEDLRAKLPEAFKSPFVRSLLDSPEFKEGFVEARVGEKKKRVSELAKQPWESVRDSLFGDAVVMAFRIGFFEERQKSGKGEGMLLILKPRDPEVLKTLLESALGRDDLGAAAKLRKEHLGVPYTCRDVKSRSPKCDYFAQFEDGAFVWSDDESWLKAAIEQRTRSEAKLQGLAASLARIRKDAASGSFINIYLNMKWFSSLLTGRASSDEESRKSAGLVGRSLADVVLFAASLEIGDDVVIRFSQLFSSDRKLYGNGDRRDPGILKLLERAPGAVVVFGGSFDLPGVLDFVSNSGLLDPNDERTAKLAKLGLEGMLNGIKLDDLLKKIGPMAIAVVPRQNTRAKSLSGEGSRTGELHSNSSSRRGSKKHDEAIQEESSTSSFDLIGLFGVGGEDKGQAPAEALENAARTLLAFVGMDQTQRPSPVESEIGGFHATTLIGGDRKVWPVVARKGGILLFGTSMDVVREFLAATPPKDDSMTAAYMANLLKIPSRAFLFIDLHSAHALFKENRKRIDLWLEDQDSAKFLEALFSLDSYFESVTMICPPSEDPFISTQTLTLHGKRPLKAARGISSGTER